MLLGGVLRGLHVVAQLLVHVGGECRSDVQPDLHLVEGRDSCAGVHLVRHLTGRLDEAAGLRVAGLVVQIVGGRVDQEGHLPDPPPAFLLAHR